MEIRERILDGASQEIALNGSGFRMDDLAKPLNISKRTLYENFSSKEDLVRILISMKLEDVDFYHEKLLVNEELTFKEKFLK